MSSGSVKDSSPEGFETRQMKFGLGYLLIEQVGMEFSFEMVAISRNRKIRHV